MTNSSKNARIILDALQAVERLAAASKWQRFVHHPVKYILAQLHRFLLYPFMGPVHLTAKTFWKDPFELKLPAGMDIYLTGGKTHSSEIRLAKYACRNLPADAVVFDIGAHFGYFSLLFAKLADNGHVYAFEGAPSSLPVLKTNLGSSPRCSIIPKLVVDASGSVAFYQYDTLHSEFNTTDDAQFAGSTWRKKIKPFQLQVPAVTLDEFCRESSVTPSFIKLDVEGGEYKVLMGAKGVLPASNCSIVMEFLCERRGNAQHKLADALLQSWQYRPFKLNDEGMPEAITDIEAYLQHQQLESDNILYQKDKL